MEGECYTSPSASSSTPTSSIGKRKHGRQQNQEKPYRGIRMRKWARAYDTAVFYLRGPSVRLNFPDLIHQEDELCDVSAASIRKKATEVGAKVDALQTALHASPGDNSPANRLLLSEKPDLNEYPENCDEE
ncbi:hypothetical protein H0E87_004686 [Populus deltoides]|uniref:AP2/ERF domain-containing protein n=1 Tax=Populus deltoides TaxID=3696 RepID=A0A8T2ZGI1_POPDE|nr:hypothetical protein H0E87_004686 [Populus deltoides]